MVGAWDAENRCVFVVPETRARLRALSLLDMDSVAPLIRRSLVCQLPVSRSSLVV